jgi:hypothetical protein
VDVIQVSGISAVAIIHNKIVDIDEQIALLNRQKDLQSKAEALVKHVYELLMDSNTDEAIVTNKFFNDLQVSLTEFKEVMAIAGPVLKRNNVIYGDDVRSFTVRYLYQA